MKSAADSPAEVQRLQVRNDRKRPVDFFMEPWGTRVAMPAGAVFEVVVRPTQPGRFEVAVGEDHVTVYGWTGARFAVYCDGRFLAGSEVPVPPVPANVEHPA